MKKILVLLAITTTMVAVQAELLPIVNGDFEDTSVVYPDGATGWTVSSYGIGSILFDGDRACIFNVGTNSQTINQTVSYALVSGTTYNMSFDLNNGQADSTWTQFNAQLWAKHPTLSTIVNIGNYHITPDDFPSSDQQWMHFDFDYVLGDGYTNWVPFVQFQVVGGYRPYLDNVTLETVPEPVAMGIIGAGGLVVFLKRKRA